MCVVRILRITYRSTLNMLKIYEADTGIQDYYRVDLKVGAYGCVWTNFQPAAAYRDTDALGANACMDG